MRRHAAAADELAHAYRMGYAAGLKAAMELARLHANTDLQRHGHLQTCAEFLAEEFAALLAQPTAPLTRP
jgi:hypothetical protein